MISNTEAATQPTTLPSEEISLLDLLIAIIRRMRLVATVALCVTAIGFITGLLMPVKYTAMTSILPPQQGSSAGAALLAQLGSLGSVASMAGGIGLKNPNDLQVALLRSERLEDAMLDRFHLVELYHAPNRTVARGMLAKNVFIDNGMKDGLIRIAVTDKDAARATDMANGYVAEYRKLNGSLAVSEASQRRLFFEQQLNQAKENLIKAEEDLKRSEQKSGVVQLDTQARATIELVSQLRAQIASKEVQISAMRSFATGENPDLQMAEQQLAGLRAQEGRIGGAAESASNPLIAKGNIPDTAIEYVRRLREVKYSETLLDLLARQYEVAKVDEARQGMLVQVVDPATVPEFRSAPRRTLITLGSLAFGIFLGLICAFIAEGYTRLKSDPADSSRLETLKALLTPWRQVRPRP